MKQRIPAKIVERDGKIGYDLTGHSERNLQNLMRSLNGQNVWISIEKQTKNRTIPQNAYLWGVVYAEIAKETDNDVESVHHAMKDMFLKTYTEGPIPKVQSTSKLSTVDFMRYVENIIKWAGEFLCMYIEMPNETAMWGDTRRV